MKNKLFSRLLITAALILAIYPSVQVQAKVQDFPELYLELNVPDDTIILTKDTPDTDGQWKAAGITDPKTEKDNFDKMGVKAILYDPNTKTTVRLLQKQSSDTKEIFNLSQLPEEELNEFLDGLAASDDENTKTSIEKYPGGETTFFRYSIEMTQEGKPLTEIIYGTIVNGCTVSFDAYSENSTKPLDESFMKELVTGTHFTRFLNKTEVEKQERDSVIRLAVGFVILVAIIILLILISKNKSKKQKALKERKTEALTKFYKEQKQKEEQNIKDSVLFVNRTQYSEDVFKNFYYYNEIIKKWKFWLTTAALFLVILVLLYHSKSALLGCTIAVILMFVFVYYQGIRIEKSVGRTMKIYEKNKSMEAIFTFYESYFTLSGIQYISKYSYTQISEIKKYKDYIYIYFSPEKAFYLKKDGFEQNTDDFIKFIKQRTLLSFKDISQTNSN